jgi:hypothetical protein
VKTHIDTSFAVHADLKSHTGDVLTLGKGAAASGSTKQKVNTRTSTDAELIGLDDKIGKVMWTKHFLEAQGYDVKDTIVHQDNISTLKLAENELASAESDHPI